MFYDDRDPIIIINLNELIIRTAAPLSCIIIWIFVTSEIGCENYTRRFVSSEHKRFGAEKIVKCRERFECRCRARAGSCSKCIYEGSGCSPSCSVPSPYSCADPLSGRSAAVDTNARLCPTGGLQRDLRGLGGGRHHTELRAGRGQHAASGQTGGHADRRPGGQVRAARGERAPDRVQPGRARGRLRGRRAQEPEPDHGPGPGRAAVREPGPAHPAGLDRRPVRRRDPLQRREPHTGRARRLAAHGPRGLLSERRSHAEGLLQPVRGRRHRHHLV